MFQIDEIVWARIRGYPWWPCRIVNPTPDNLAKLFIDKVLPDQRLVWFFNDNDNHTVVNIKGLRPFCDERIIVETENKTGKHAARLKAAFEQASIECGSLNDLEDDDAIDAVAVTNANPMPARTSARQARKSKKRTAPDLNGSPNIEELPSKQRQNNKRKRAASVTNATHAKRKPVPDMLSQKKLQITGRPSGDAESDRLSTHCSPSPCDRSSLETGIDTSADVEALNDNPPRSNLLRLRIREKSSLTDRAKRNNSVRQESSASKQKMMEHSAHISSGEDQLCKNEQHSSLQRRERFSRSVKRRVDSFAERDDVKVHGNGGVCAKRGKTGKASATPPKLHHSAAYNGEVGTKRKREMVTERNVDRVKLEMSAARSPDLAMETIDGNASNEDNDDNFKASYAKQPILESKHSTEVTRIRAFERVSLSDAPLRRSRRMRKVSSKLAGRDEESERESEDDDQRQVASKRSRGVEAPRKSDGQRRLHIRQEGNEKRFGDGDDKVSYDAIEEAARPFQGLSKDECIKVILRMQDELRRKSVQLWLRGRKLVKAQDVLRTEEGLIKACEPGIEEAEKLLRWVKKHEEYDKGDGSRFYAMEKKAVEECEGLVEIYFDRRRVRLNKIGHRVLQLTKEMSPISRKLTNVLENLLALWLDLASAPKSSYSKSRQ